MKKIYLFSIVLLQLFITNQSTAQTYVDAAATGSNNGTSWANAYTNLQTAITATTAGNEVWVAAGTYQPGAGVPFNMKEGVKVYGGFTSGMTLFSSRNYVTNVTNLIGNGVGIVAFASTITNATILDGFRLNGNTTHAIDNSAGGSPIINNLIVSNNINATTNRGGGMTSNGIGRPVLNNVLFSGNSSTNSGGAIYLSTNGLVGGGLMLTNVTFLNNSTSGVNGGGALYCNLQNGTTTGNLVMMDSVVFDGNTTSTNTSGGGALYVTGNGGEVIGTQVVFVNNTVTGSSSGWGGAVYAVVSNSALRLSNTLFINNSVTSPNGYGGALSMGTSAVANGRDTLINVTFVNNSVTGATTFKGGAVWDNSNGASAPQAMYLANCIFYNNTKGTGAASSDIEYGSTNQYVTLHNNYFQNAASFNTSGRTNMTQSGNVQSTTNPFYTTSPVTVSSAKGPDGLWMTGDDGLHLVGGSAAIDAGNNTDANNFSIPADIAGTARIQNTTVDMGAYEGAFSILPVNLISFTGNLQNGTAQLQWLTATEDNFYHFELQQSNDAQSYTTIATISPKGSNSNYNFSTKQLEARKYYRLRMVEINGQYSFSNAVVLSQSVVAPTSLQLYPNPAKTYIVVRLQKAGTVNIYDASGRLVKTQKAVAGANTIDINNIAPGINFCEADGSRVQFMKL